MPDFIDPGMRVFGGLFLTGWLLFSPGCGAGAPYPEAAVTTPLGQAGQCAACRSSIPSVGEEHLFKFQGVQHIVCREACKPVLEEQILHQ